MICLVTKMSVLQFQPKCQIRKSITGFNSRSNSQSPRQIKKNITVSVLNKIKQNKKGVCVFPQSRVTCLSALVTLSVTQPPELNQIYLLVLLLFFDSFRPELKKIRRSQFHALSISKVLGFEFDPLHSTPISFLIAPI